MARQDLQETTVCPGELFESATEENVAAVAHQLQSNLLDPKMPEFMRGEIRDYLSDLARTFPEQLLD